MIYEVKKDEVVFEIDDNLLFDSQPQTFRRLYNDLKENDRADFDNCNVLVLATGRVIITEKQKTMGKYNFRDKYEGLDESIDNVAFFSALSATAYDQRIRSVYTRTNPAKSHGVVDLKRNSGVTKNVFSGGIHTGSIVTEASANNNYLHMVGSGMDSTIWNKSVNAYGEGSSWQNSLYFYNMTVNQISQSIYRTGYTFVRCAIYSDLLGTKHSCKLYAKTHTNGETHS